MGNFNNNNGTNSSLINYLSKVSVLSVSTVVTVIMFYLVMFVLNPNIDSSDGFSVIKLQLAFDQTVGLNIINSWGSDGVAYFLDWIYLDYIYAASYSLFFSSLLAYLLRKKCYYLDPRLNLIVFVPFFAGFLDCLENTMEVFFLRSPNEFINEVFWFHSMVAAVKWMMLPLILLCAIYISTFGLTNKDTCRAADTSIRLLDKPE
ncbi:hypothetical protein [Thaumasiovibrio sp. DFM-14]|uniref:hypothetical protein n=1 Tax=Thaumasiovibrio sp. DFM-14 TaxID=3384792 RepID=UPI0039A1502F